MMVQMGWRSAVAALVAVMVTCVGCSHRHPPTGLVIQDGANDQLPRIAVATAYGPELDGLLPELTRAAEQTVNGITYYTGQIEGQDVVLFKTGVSIVNATMSTQILLDRFAISEIIVSGVAGGVDPALSIGDVTAPARWGKYDEWVFMREVASDEYVAPSWFGEPEHASFGYMRPQGAVIARDGDPNPAPQFWWPVDAGMLAIAEQAAERVSFERCSTGGQCLGGAAHVEVGGNGVSGSIFMDNADVRAYVQDTFDAQVVDMETAAIGMVAHANGVPYVAFRTLSDLAGGGHAGANEIDAFEEIAAQNSAAFVLEYMRVRAEQAAHR